MGLLGKGQIQNVNDVQWEDIPVPEWDDAAEDGKAMVRIRGLSGDEVDKYEASLMRLRKGKPDLAIQSATARLVAWCLVDENMSRLFVNEDEVKELGKKSGRALQRCFDKAAELSGLRPGDVEAMVGDFS
jgi:hypothetical protein